MNHISGGEHASPLIFNKTKWMVPDEKRNLKKCIYQINTNLVQLSVCQYGVWNHDGRGGICMI